MIAPAPSPSGARLRHVWRAVSAPVADYVRREFNTSTGLAASFWYMLGSAVADGRHHDWKRVAWEVPAAAAFKALSHWKGRREVEEDRRRFPEAFAAFARHGLECALDHVRTRRRHADDLNKS
ncbi:MAG: hypothetical protein PW734_04270 [Verrucomicrobium sp.]|nr:hypothetical protein [Verrucomicrobium sp.]